MSEKMGPLYTTRTVHAILLNAMCSIVIINLNIKFKSLAVSFVSRSSSAKALNNLLARLNEHTPFKSRY